MIPVKICGITNVSDTQLTVNLGASALGMIFYNQSPRYVSNDLANRISDAVGNKIAKVGVFVNERIEIVQQISRDLKLDFVQLHGDESPEYCEKMICPVIKAFRIGEDFDTSILADFKVSAFLFDTYLKELAGGTGEIFNWEQVSNLNLDTPIIISGGLNPENILNAIDTVQPNAVDVNSGVELKPGVKDEVKMNQLFTELTHTGHEKNIFREIEKAV